MKKTILILIIGLVAIAGCTSSTGITATVYKSPSCSCCSSYSADLGREGYNVKIVKTDMNSIHQKYNIPSQMESCHTTIIARNAGSGNPQNSESSANIGDYFIEGHVPIEAIKKLLEEKPDIDGIALPDMPSGSPGMPGIKRGPFTIYALKNGEASVFMTI